LELGEDILKLLREKRMNDYREKIYGRYVTLGLRERVNVTKEQLEQMARWYKRAVGRFLPEDREISILDLGCGHGTFLYFLKKEGYKNILGVDISREQIELAKKIGIKEVKCQDVLHFLRNTDGEFNVITAFDLIEHFRKDEVLLLSKLVYRALKVQGLFILRTINGESPFSGRLRYADLTHEICFTRTSISAALLSANFRKVKVFPAYHYFPRGVRSNIKYILWKIFEFGLRVYMMAETGNFRDDYIFTQNLLAVAYK
jgi:2-polyprenyl-3-methyl-5-hydroxy-6-metoxy-1,4-benzoquinol methylase